MKPDWKDAPEWANWLAMDGDGVWFWYELEPVWSPSYGVWKCKGWGEGRFEEAGRASAGTTREARPHDPA